MPQPRETRREGAAGGRRHGTTASRKSTASRRSPAEARIADVALTHPDRVLYPDQGATKLALARYYRDVESWIMPLLRRRPLVLVRCPQGRARQCFYQKHPGEAMGEDIPRLSIREKQGTRSYLYVEELPHVIALVQAGTLELHVWGSRVDDVEKPDLLVFDLDPGDGVPWRAVIDQVRSLGERLRTLGLEGFVRTTGGKGLHVVVPLEPKLGWEQAKAFAHGVASAQAGDHGDLVTTNMSKSRRRGRIFLDYLRNGRGATAIASYSTRARAGAPVAVPVRWDELGSKTTGDRYHLDNVRRRLTALSADPWRDFERSRRPLTRAMLDAVGAGRLRS